jgi:hypothetical protein|tara:strand:- start:135 stop:437 length:303 start_codon:yes stop_codon:yes gene_type:complete
MANRYQDTKIKKNSTGTRVYKPTIYPKIPIENSDIIIKSIEGDRLEILAEKYYGDTSLWWIIAAANNLGKGVMALTPGEEIRIPGDTQSIYNGLKEEEYV